MWVLPSTGGRPRRRGSSRQYQSDGEEYDSSSERPADSALHCARPRVRPPNPAAVMVAGCSQQPIPRDAWMAPAGPSERTRYFEAHSLIVGAVPTGPEMRPRGPPFGSSSHPGKLGVGEPWMSGRRSVGSLRRSRGRPTGASVASGRYRPSSGDRPIAGRRVPALAGEGPAPWASAHSAAHAHGGDRAGRRGQHPATRARVRRQHDGKRGVRRFCRRRRAGVLSGGLAGRPWGFPGGGDRRWSVDPPGPAATPTPGRDRVR